MRNGICCVAVAAGPGALAGHADSSYRSDSRAGARDGGFSTGICERDRSAASAASAPNGITPEEPEGALEDVPVLAPGNERAVQGPEELASWQ